MGCYILKEYLYLALAVGEVTWLTTMQSFKLEAQNIQRYTTNVGWRRGSNQIWMVFSPALQAALWLRPWFTSSTWNKLSPGLSCNPKPNPNLNPNPVIIIFFEGKEVHTSHFLVIDCKQSWNGHRHIHTSSTHAHINTLTHTHSGRAAVACVIMRQSLEGLIWTALYHLPGNGPQL